MTREAAARSVALRDQLAATLRDSATPLSTPQLAVRSGTPWVEFDFRGRCSVVHWHAEQRGWRIVVCQPDGDHRVAEPPPSSRVYPHLVALEKAGVVARVRYPDRESILAAELTGTLDQHIAEHSGNRCVYWHYAASRTDATFDSLIAALGER